MSYTSLVPATHARPFVVGDKWKAVEHAELTADNLDDHEARLVDHETRIDLIEAGSGGDVDGPAASVEKEIALFDGTTGKLLERATGTGFVKVTAGVMQTPVATVNLGTEVAGFPLIVFLPADNEPPAAAFATSGSRNAHPVLEFDGTTDEEAVFTRVLPNTYAGSGLTVDTFWAFTAATSGSLRVQAAIERIDLSSLDIDADSFAAFQSAGGTAPATSGMVIKVTVTFTSGAQMDSLAAGEMFRLKIRRDADGTSGTDDIATDAQLLAVTVRHT